MLIKLIQKMFVIVFKKMNINNGKLYRKKEEALL